MTDNKKGYSYYLQTYGSDLSLWPEKVLKSIDLDTLKSTEAFQNEAALDHHIRSAIWPSVNAQLKNKILSALEDPEPKMATFFSIRTQLSVLKNAFLVTAIMLTSLLSGIQYGYILDKKTKSEYSEAILKTWYYGSVYAYAGTGSGDNENE